MSIGSNNAPTLNTSKNMTKKRKPEVLESPDSSPIQISDVVVRVTRSQAFNKKSRPNGTGSIAKKFVQHGTYWLPDGNTLVQIGGVRFKLDRSTLVNQSAWFLTMIENPPNDSDKCIYKDEETGETVYCLDSLKVNVKDFVALLNAFDNAVTYFSTPPSLKTVAAILRAADALDSDRFKTFGIYYLENNWPANFKKFDGGVMEHVVDSAELAWKYKIDSALKRALYELVRADDFRPSTGSQDKDHRLIETVKFHRTWLIRAREKLTAFWMKKAVPPKVHQCVSPNNTEARKQCAITRGIVHVPYSVLVHDSGTFFRYRQDPMVGLQALIDAPWSRQGICSRCANSWRATWRIEKEELWHYLDTW
ncbi:hypothetical protein F5887DRAFT_1170042, partial [Amanita rubescens]